MSDKNDYKPESDLIEALAKPVIEGRLAPKVTASAIDGYAPAPCINQKIQITAEEIKVLAAEHIKDTLDSLKELLNDLKKLAPASQNSYFYQTASMLAKTRMEGALMLLKLEDSSNPDEPKEKGRGGAHSNHLHLNLTSDKMAELLEAQIKKRKDEQK